MCSPSTLYCYETMFCVLVGPFEICRLLWGGEIIGNALAVVCRRVYEVLVQGSHY